MGEWGLRGLCRAAGVKGAFKGMGRGVSHAVTRPIKGFGLASYSIWESVNDSSIMKRSNSTK